MRLLSDSVCPLFPVRQVGHMSFIFLNLNLSLLTTGVRDRAIYANMSPNLLKLTLHSFNPFSCGSFRYFNIGILLKLALLTLFKACEIYFILDAVILLQCKNTALHLFLNVFFFVGHLHCYCRSVEFDQQWLTQLCSNTRNYSCTIRKLMLS